MPTNILINICSGDENSPEAVLIRATEPISGLEHIKKIRNQDGILSKAKLISLTNGPAKVGKSLNISKVFNRVDLVTSEEIFITEDSNIDKFEVTESKRINIDYAEDYKDKLWRFHIKDNKFVSKG